MNFAELLPRAVLVLIPMILSLTVHEFAHAAAAKGLGDDTAEHMGRLNLNPLAHIDPVGTVLLPLLMLTVGGGGFFGWAKPVPFNPTRFRRSINPRTGAMIVASAGPLSNLLMAGLFMAVLATIVHGGYLATAPEALIALSSQMVVTNVGLAVFNLIPVHPLDGQKVVVGLLPLDAALRFERFSVRSGSILLIAVMLFGGRLIAVPFSMIMRGLSAIFGVPLA